MKQSHVSIPTEVDKQSLWSDDNDPSMRTQAKIEDVMLTPTVFQDIIYGHAPNRNKDMSA